MLRPLLQIRTRCRLRLQSLSLDLLPQTTNVLTGTLTSTSQGSRAVTYSIETQGVQGAATITDAATGTFSYSTTANSVVSDNFTYKVNDGAVDSRTSTMPYRSKQIRCISINGR